MIRWLISHGKIFHKFLHILCKQELFPYSITFYVSHMTNNKTKVLRSISTLQYSISEHLVVFKNRFEIIVSGILYYTVNCNILLLFYIIFYSFINMG